MTEKPPAAAARDLFTERAQRRRDSLSPSLARVIAFIDDNRIATLNSSAVDIARAAGTSDATVIRAVQALGFSGLQELRQALVEAHHEKQAPVDNLRRTLADSEEDVDAALDAVRASYAAGLAQLQDTAFQKSIHAALRVLGDAGRIVIFAIGPTAHLGAYLSERLRRKGLRTARLNRQGAGLADQLLDLAPGDALLMLAYGKPYREAIATLAEASRLLLPVVLITDSPHSAMGTEARVTITVPRGSAERVALNGMTLFTLETLMIGLAAQHPRRSVATLARLERLRKLTRQENRRRLAQPPEEG